MSSKLLLMLLVLGLVAVAVTSATHSEVSDILQSNEFCLFFFIPIFHFQNYQLISNFSEYFSFLSDFLIGASGEKFFFFFLRFFYHEIQLFPAVSKIC